jgi:type IV secretion system protein VirD4
MKNYAGHRLSPWLGHLMVSRQETARPLMTAGEVMQLPSTDEIVMVAGSPPIKAKKARYFEDRRFTERIFPPPAPSKQPAAIKADDWSTLAPLISAATAADNVPLDDAGAGEGRDPANAGLRREPGLERHQDIAPDLVAPPANEFEPDLDRPDDVVIRARARRTRAVARQAAQDPGDQMAL